MHVVSYKILALSALILFEVEAEERQRKGDHRYVPEAIGDYLSYIKK